MHLFNLKRGGGGGAPSCNNLKENNNKKLGKYAANKIFYLFLRALVPESVTHLFRRSFSMSLSPKIAPDVSDTETCTYALMFCLFTGLLRGETLALARALSHRSKGLSPGSSGICQPWRCTQQAVENWLAKRSFFQVEAVRGVFLVFYFL